MTESSSDVRDALVELIEASPDATAHPSPDRWLAYHRGELAADEEAALQEHLVRCRDCFDLAAAAAAFARPDEEPDAGPEVETAALWRLLRSQLAPAPQGAPKTLAGRRRSSRVIRLPLAASFFVALVGLLAWNLRQRSVLSDLRAPRPNAPIVAFTTAGERLGGPEPTAKTLRASTGPWMFVFHPADERPAYRLALRDAATGGELGSYVLRPDEDFALTLQLPAGLPPGRYRLELADGAAGPSGRVLETHHLQVTGPGRRD